MKHTRPYQYILPGTIVFSIFLMLIGICIPDFLKVQACYFFIELQAYTADRLTQILWGLSNDTRTVPSVLADLHGLSADSDTDVQSYDSPEEFEAALAALKEGG